MADKEVRQKTWKGVWREQSRKTHENLMTDIPEAEKGTSEAPPSPPRMEDWRPW